MNLRKLRRSDLVYPDLCYQIIGILFDVYNELGPGYREKYYQKAIATALQKHGLSFKAQIPIPVKYQGNEVGNYFLDFIIENKLVLEIKRGEEFRKRNIEQIYSYLKASKLKLGILANFTRQGLKFKRIVNLT